MSPTLLAILRSHKYWYQAMGYDKVYINYPHFRAINMIHRVDPTKLDKRKNNPRRELPGWRGRPITYATMHMLRGDRPERII